MSGRSAASADEQERYYRDADESVKRNAFYMQESLDKGNLSEAIRHASTMINELRTSRLFPTKYYELYMNVTNNLRFLESHMEDEYRKKSGTDRGAAEQWVKDWYNRVQFCGNIIPRLYLLITVASVCLKQHKGENEEVVNIIFDLAGLTKGVQHPTRGLFLRNYLSQTVRSVLPDVGDDVDLSLEEEPVMKQSIDFVLTNFAEMTRLWVRMQHQGAVRDRTRREKERLQLRMLVGTNLRRLSELNSITKTVYKDYVLKSISEQIVKCKDRIAQDYLMECLIMVFSDEYHLATLADFLGTVNKLHSSVNVNAIICKLMDRLAKYAKMAPENRQSFEETDVFEIFQRCCREIIEKHKKMALHDVLSLHVELVHFAAQCYPGRDEYIAAMVGEAVAAIRREASAGVETSDEEPLPAQCVPHVCRMIVAPLASMQLRVLGIADYCELITFLKHEQRRKVAADMVASLAEQDSEDVYLKTPEDVTKLFGMIEPLLFDEDGAGAKSSQTKPDVDEDEESQEEDSDSDARREHRGGEEKVDEGFRQEQELVAKLVHLIRNVDIDLHYQTLYTAGKVFGRGGDSRLVYTFPALVFNTLALIDRALCGPGSGAGGDEEQKEPQRAFKTKPKKMFQMVHKICHVYGSHRPEAGVRLWLHTGLLADKCGFNREIAYEFLSQAFLCYEDYVSDSREQYEALRVIVGGLQAVKNLDEENFDTLRAKAAQHSARLLKKPACARALSLCCHLFWDCADPEFRDAEKAAKTLNRAGKKANSMMDCAEKSEIFIEILNKYVHLAVNRCPVDFGKVGQLIEVIKEQIKENEDEPGIQEVKEYFRSTLQFIRALSQNEDDPEIADTFRQIAI